MAGVKLQRITKRYHKTVAVENLSLDIADGEFVSLVGPSGCGKSTTLRMVAGLEEISAGELYIGDRLANDIPPKDRGISMVFQSYALFPHMSVAENIAFGLKIKKIPRPIILEKIDWALNLLDLHGLGDRRPRELSGGQRQRVALGRALVLNPEVLLLDEPLSNLDATLRLRMRTELKRIHRKIGATIIYVTHDQVEAMTLSDRIAILNKGILMQVGSPTEVYNSPANRFVAGFIGSFPMNFFSCSLGEEKGKFLIRTKDFTLSVPQQFTERLSQVKSQLLLLGVRPEHITQRDTQTERNGKEFIPAIVDVVEPLGSELVVTLSTGTELFQAIFPESNLKSEDRVEIVIDATKTHLFEEESGKAIW